ncbi:MAG: hypothetical protein IJV45_02740 [Prevotella sp.]|nr:hypothetical protein [Prevotella sp.]
MNCLTRLRVWLCRIHHCRGFGVQSPTDYRFVRYVINEHWPYYAYEQLGEGCGWLRRKTGELMLRISNWRQPSVVIDQAGYADYMKAGCRSAIVLGYAEAVIELACVPVDCRWEELFSWCNAGSVVVVTEIWRSPSVWKQMLQHPAVRVSFDLYYCGILLFDPSRAKHHYIVNF